MNIWAVFSVRLSVLGWRVGSNLDTSKYAVGSNKGRAPPRLSTCRSPRGQSLSQVLLWVGTKGAALLVL